MATASDLANTTTLDFFSKPLPSPPPGQYRSSPDQIAAGGSTWAGQGSACHLPPWSYHALETGSSK